MRCPQPSDLAAGQRAWSALGRAPPTTASPGAALWEEARRLAGTAVFPRLLVALLAVDAALVAFHLLQDLREMRLIDGGGYLLDSPRFRIDEDGGYGEFSAT